MTDPHTVLGIRPDATQDEIRSAWRALVRRSHPDLDRGSATAGDRMKAINAAHDAMLEALVRAKRTAAEARRSASAPARDRTGAPQRPAANGRRAAPGGSFAADPASAAAAGADGSAVRYPPRFCPPPERPFPAQRRIVPDTPTLMKMRAVLVGRLRQIIHREISRGGGASYTVPGQPDWRDEAAVLGRGGLPATCLVSRIDLEGRTLRLHLDVRPEPGRLLVAMPRFRLAGGRIERQGGAVVLEVAVSSGAREIRLARDSVERCIEGGRGLSLEFAQPVCA